MDHCEVKKRKANPRDSANIFSLLTFAYSTDLFKNGLKKDFEESDLYEVVNNCESKYCGDILEKAWQEECRHDNNPSLFKAIYRVVGFRYLLWGVTQAIVEILSRTLEPDALGNLVSYFQPGQTKHSTNDACRYVATILVSNFVSQVYFYNFDLYLFGMSIEVRTALCSLLFRKLLRISTASESGLGNVVTLITKDVQQIKRSTVRFNDIWIFGSLTVVISYLLYSKIGVISLLPTCIYLLVFPLQVFIGKLMNKLRKEASEETDERLQITKEVLSAIKIIKMYTWEDFFYDKIKQSRQKEISKVVLIFYLRVVLILLGNICSKIGLYLIIMGYIWMEQPPDASVIFSITSYYATIMLFFGEILPESTGKFAELFATLTRIKHVLVAEELSENKNIKGHNVKPLVELTNVTIKIGDYEILSDINLKTGLGLTLVTGGVGCGKSTLLKTILKEYTLCNGDVKCNGVVSYASQDPWCFPSTIKQNIIFGEPLDENRYQEILKLCTLEYDLSLFKEGDEIILTDNGQNLSKGQQSRINLARAIYKKSDIYLLDDCLSSLDVHVNRIIFDKCIKTFLKDKICILVTQAENILQEADQVYVMEKGRIVHHYKPKQLQESIPQTKLFVSADNPGVESFETEKLLKTEHTTYKNIYQETLKKGGVSTSIYRKYVAYGGGVLLLCIILILVGLKQTADSLAEKLLFRWTDQKQNISNIQMNITAKNGTSLSSDLDVAEHQARSTFTMFTIFLTASLFLEIIKSYTLLNFCRRASINIHKAMMRNVLQAVMTFFDTHFIGNVINRFSQDVINIDENLPFQLLNFYSNVFAVAGAVALLISVNPYFSAYTVIASVVLTLMLKLYLPVARNLQRLEASTRSPMIGHLNAALEGITTIRAFKAEMMIVEEYERHQNVFTSAHYTVLSFQYAFGFFMSMLSTIMVTAVLCSFIFFDTGTSAGSVDLAVVQILSLGELMKASKLSWADLENLMTAVERALEYTGVDIETKEGIVPTDWSNEGTVSYEDVSLSYNNTQLILNNLSFDIGSKQKIGIVGRTGAGKSSIISTIFRLYEVQGKITINGVNIKTLPLNYLRKHLAVIPQDPVLFSGTVRSNLDPFNKFKEEDLWTALEKSNLKGCISNLDTNVGRNSFNFSLGQKRMICMARAVLNKSKIVILDEATANMDHETEYLLNESIKNNFFDCTVLIVAHKLRSVVDCDRVMVIDGGKIKEFEDPKILSKKKNGLFYKMIEQRN